MKILNVNDGKPREFKCCGKTNEKDIDIRIWKKGVGEKLIQA